MMKWVAWIGLGLVLTVFLVACAPKGARETSPVAQNNLSLKTDYENAVPVLSQLMLGTFRLEGTDQAISAAQAKELLPLWRAYRSLSSSDSASSVELEALVRQIAETMTDEQLQAIAAMRLTGQDMRTVMEAQGIQLGAGGRMGNLSPQEIATRQAQRPGGGGGGMVFIGPGGGGPPGGGFPGGGFPGGPPGGGQAPGAEQIATLRAQRGSGAGGSATQGPLFDALISLLRSKVS